MNVLFLGYMNSPLIDFLIESDNVLSTDEKIDSDLIIDAEIDFIVSYGYRWLIKKEVLDLVNAINLHISYLPYNRGADPNFWSVIDDTPKGVTIHQVDEFFDTGDILLQELVDITEKDTLRTSYDKLQKAVQKLFKENWGSIKNRTCKGTSQVGKGSYHRSMDKEKYTIGIKNNYLDMETSKLIDYVRRMR